MIQQHVLTYIMVAVGVLIGSMILYLIGALKNDRKKKFQAGQCLFFGWFLAYAFYRITSPDDEPRYFEANLTIEADGRGVCALPLVGLYPRDLLILARAGLGSNSNQPVEIELDVRAEKGGEVALTSKDRLMPDRGGQWEQIKKEIRPMTEGDHVLTVKTSGQVGTVQVKLEY